MLIAHQLAPAPSISAPATSNETSSYLSLSGCWRRDLPATADTPAGFVLYCFRPTGVLEGGFLEGGHGGDLLGSWSFGAEGKLIINEDRCSFQLQPAGETFMLSECDNAGNWKRVTDAF